MQHYTVKWKMRSVEDSFVLKCFSLKYKAEREINVYKNILEETPKNLVFLKTDP